MEKKKLLLYVCDITYRTNNEVNKIKCICDGGEDQIEEIKESQGQRWNNGLYSE